MDVIATRLLKNCVATSGKAKNLTRWFSGQKPVDLEKRRAEMLAKGLPKRRPIEGVENIILVSSGKGGVGKSTLAATTLKLVQPEKNVGLLDADVFGPSIPLMMNLNAAPLLTDKNLMVPLVNFGVKCMSMGFLVDESSPVIWRGLMVMQAIEKLTRQVDWGAIDYLVVDTPPGTGDTHLSLVQNLPIAGVILITTPQPAALQVTRRGAVMYKKLDVPIIGLVENMSTITCPSCTKEMRLFGDGTSSLANELNVQILGSLPLHHVDMGAPTAVSKPNSKESGVFRDVAKSVVEFLNVK